MTEGIQVQTALTLSQGPKFPKREINLKQNRTKHTSIDWYKSLGSLKHHSGNAREQK